MAKFKFSAFGQHLELHTPRKGLSDEYNVYSAKFEFHSPDWDGMNKWAHFINQRDPDNPILAMLDENDEITPERSLLLDPGMYEVFVHGDLVEGNEIVRGVVNKRLVTNPVDILIIPSSIEAGNDYRDVFPEFSQEDIDEIEGYIEDTWEEYVMDVDVTLSGSFPSAGNPPSCSAGFQYNSDPDYEIVDLKFNHLQANTITAVTADTDNTSENRGKLSISLSVGSPVTFNNAHTLVENWDYYTFADSDSDGNIVIDIASI